jgi:hypothetical protein
MASFRQHTSISAVLAFLLLPVSLFILSATLSVSLLASLWCWFAGMMPDIDSDTGRPLDLIFGQLMACLPLLVIAQLPEGVALSTVTLVFVAVYYIIKHPIRRLFEKYTVHRGVFHSVPMSFLTGLLVTIAYRREGSFAWLIGGAVILGYLSHLALDEIFSIDLLRVRVKRSFGTALKISAGSLSKNILLYGLLVVAILLASMVV